MDKLSKFIEKGKKIHKYESGKPFFNYDKVIYINCHEKVIITCPLHGDFKQTPHAHLQGRNCPECAKIERFETQKYNDDIFANKGRNLHKDENGKPKYNYDKTVYVHSRLRVIITCLIHGDFEQLPSSHLHGNGCPKCAIELNSIHNLSCREDFITKGNLLHNNFYNYGKSIYRGAKEKLIITCPLHGDFEQIPNNHLTGSGCTKCGFDSINREKISIMEKELSDYIFSIFSNIITSNRTILDNGKELDIYIPDKKTAIEFNGLYWHNELNKSEKYHLQKTEECLSKGIRLIHIFEDEWIYKQDIVKSRIRNIIGVTKNHYYGRKCVLKNISKSESNQFLEANHIQGKGSNSSSSVQIGLYYENKLVSLMTFGSLRKNLGSEPKEGHYELIRFCNLLDTNVVGGASKLLSYFIRTYRPKNIISYCDRRWSEGNLYEKLGFTFSHNSQPNYWYIKGNIRYNRSKYTKQECVKQGCPETKSEREFCLSNKIYRIYDCGSKVYELKIK